MKFSRMFAAPFQLMACSLVSTVHFNTDCVSAGDVIDSKADGNGELLKFWPQLQSEVSQWKFTPFEKTSDAVTAEVEEYIDLVHRNGSRKVNVAAPILRPDSTVVIRFVRMDVLQQYPLLGDDRNQRILFNGGGFVVATGEHKGTIDQNQVRELAQKFINADFYSMDNRIGLGLQRSFVRRVEIAIDGHSKEVEDYVGSWVG